MALNLVRGFRRIGWVVTFPLAAFLVLVFYENTKEFSPSNYEVAKPIDYDALAKQAGATSSTPGPWEKYRSQPSWFELNAPNMVGLPGFGKALFQREVPKDVVEKVIKDFEAKQKPPVPPPGKLDFSDLEKKVAAAEPSDWITVNPTDRERESWTFTVHKQVSKLRLTGLILGSILIWALIIQGSISILAWIFRGFKG
ncbi:MAG: hypothetical protein LAP85_27380 [Acidobacteriia bacterium]|nr:hypothetical protein [Terriglobia bacterium]